MIGILWRSLKQARWSMPFVWCIFLLLFFPENSNQFSNDTEAFDYVVVGCGISGLVVSNRLSELYNNRVLCLEAGDFDHGEDMVTIPYFIGRQPPGFYNWELSTTPQTQLNGEPRHIPLGRGVGGSSLINGMVWNRGNQETFDAWAELGNDGWSWNDLLPYFHKSEHFNLTTYPYQMDDPKSPSVNTHGTFGHVDVTYPNYFWPQTKNWFEALESLGIPTSADPDHGLSAGGYFLPLSLNPHTQTRHDARRAYYDPIQGRPNLIVRPSSTVTKVLFAEGQTSHAIGVEYQTGNSTSGFGIKIAIARKEVILAAGSIHTPQILELSGIGQADLLQKQNMTVLYNLPGVGNNLQDHAMIHLSYPYANLKTFSIRTFDTNQSFLEASESEYYSSRSGPWTAIPVEAVGYPSLPQFIDKVEQFLKANSPDTVEYLPSIYTNASRRGYLEQARRIVAALGSERAPALEILNDNAGDLDLALQRPFSRGTCHINSPDPQIMPRIDPNWLSHPLDLQIMVAAMRLNDRLIQTPALQALQPKYMDVPFNATTEVLQQFLQSRVSTEYHMCGTAAMMPLELGGVVNASLVVYGTDNLRVVDASIFPLVPAAHLQAVVYAVAEKAADLIKGINQGPARN